MRKLGTRLVCAFALLVMLAGLGSGSAAAAGNRKLVEGTVYDTTCAAACTPECPPPPHCGPITASSSSAAIICPLRERRIIACPLVGSSSAGASSQVCAPDTPCGEDGTFPVYAGEGATINIRRRGSATVLATLPVVEGYFKIRLGPGEYALHPHLPEPQCWSAIPPIVLPLTVSARWKGPIAAPISVADSCVAHPDQ
jgi:hypothetical protein